MSGFAGVHKSLLPEDQRPDAGGLPRLAHTLRGGAAQPDQQQDLQPRRGKERGTGKGGQQEREERRQGEKGREGQRQGEGESRWCQERREEEMSVLMWRVLYFLMVTVQYVGLGLKVGLCVGNGVI